MVDCGRLEICCTVIRTGGSNPSLSATFPQMSARDLQVQFSDDREFARHMEMPLTAEKI